jgi:hypothetical protein
MRESLDGYRGPKAEAKSLAEAVAKTAKTVAASVAGQAKDVGLHAVNELSGTAEAGVARGADALDGIANAIKSGYVFLCPDVGVRVNNSCRFNGDDPLLHGK